MKFHFAADHFDDQWEILHHRRAVGFPLEDGVVIHCAGQFEAPADIISAADCRIKSVCAMGFATAIVHRFVEFKHRAFAAIARSGSARTVWAWVACVSSAGILNVDGFENAQTTAGVTIPYQAGMNRPANHCETE